MTASIASLELTGFRSIESLTLDLSSSVTLLIGANGAGKSNVVDAFELLGYVVDRRLNEHLLRQGGMSQLLHRSVGGGLSEWVSIKVWGAWNGGYRNGYKAQLNVGTDDTAILSETTFMHDRNYAEPYTAHLGFSRESRLVEAAKQHAANHYALDALSGCRVFHFDDTSHAAPPLLRTDVADYETLHGDARNLAAVLLDMRSNHPNAYAGVLRSIRNVAPFFDDFVLRPDGNSLLLRWRERGIDDVFSGSTLSSGTLRFISLAVLFQQPRPPATIVLDEPELGLHPAAVHQLADLMRTHGQDRRVVAATQSVTLLGQFSLDEVAVVSRDIGSTVVARPDRAALEAWLTDYSVGELWEMNLLGGRPGGDARKTSAATP